MQTAEPSPSETYRPRQADRLVEVVAMNVGPIDRCPDIWQ